MPSPLVFPNLIFSKTPQQRHQQINNKIIFIMFKKIILSLITFVFIALNIQATYAYAISPEYKPINAPGYGVDYNAESSALMTRSLTNAILQTIAGALLYFAAPVAVFSIAQSAFTITMSGADTEKLGQGKKHLTWAIIGLVTIIFSFSVVKILISSIVGMGNYAADLTPKTDSAPAPAPSP